MTDTPSAMRIESDYLGSVSIPANDLQGVHTERGLSNLSVSGRRVGASREFVRAFALCKWAAALANRDLKEIGAPQADAIVAACEELAAGLHDRFLVIDLMEGSGGTSTNMNVNELIANRAQQILGGGLGKYDLVHPNDHVNRSQSTNDVYPAAMKIATHAMLGPVVDELNQLARSLRKKAEEFCDVLHLGRTCFQDAQPMTLGQAFLGYAALVERLSARLGAAQADLLELPLGGTAIGTGFGSPAGYKRTVFAHLANLSGIPFTACAEPFDGMQNLDTFCRISGELRTAAGSIAKVASDLILLSSGPQGGVGEIELPAVQAGSSIMPGKINPVVPMSMVQIGFAVLGNDVCIAQASQAGQLEINHYEPVVADRLFDSIAILRRGVATFREKCIAGLKASRDTNEAHVLRSSALATALVPRLGYGKVSALVRESAELQRPFLDLLEERGLLTTTEAKSLLRASAQVVA